MDQSTNQQTTALKPNAPGATASLVCGIIGLFVVGLILGIIAIVQGNKAKRLIAQNPDMYGGSGFASAGVVLGIIDLVLFVIFLFVRIAMMR